MGASGWGQTAKHYQRGYKMAKIIGSPSTYHGMRDAQRANARLIAAAPALLEALEAIFGTDEIEAGTYHIGQATTDLARAAIAAARGGA